MIRKPARHAALLALLAIPVACGDSGTDPEIVSIELFADVDLMQAGQTTALRVEILDDRGRTVQPSNVTYTSLDPQVASVNQQGVVTGLGEGEATFTAEIDDVSASVSLLIYEIDDPCTTAIPIAFGESFRASIQEGDCEGAIEDGSLIDLWFFDVAATTTVTIDMLSDDFDAYLFLFDDEGTILTEDDDDGGGTNAQIQTTLDAGTYFIAANHWPEAMGLYTISLAGAAAADPALGAPTLRLPRSALKSATLRRGGD